MSPKDNKAAILNVFARQKSKSVEWGLKPLSERKGLLRQFETFLLKNKERINGAIHEDFRKPFAEIEFSELYPVISEIRQAISNVDKWAAPRRVDTPLTYLGTRSEIHYEPRGVCLIIAPWNFPFNLCFGPLISCLAAGNTAILKPSELTPSAAALTAALVSEFFDEDLVTVIQGSAEVSTELLKLPFDHIFFTGSPGVGKIVMKAAAENLTSVTLELGGKSPVIIDKSASIKDAARRIAFGKFINNGQTCIAPDYVLIDETVKEKFIAELKTSVIELFGEQGKINESSKNYSRIVNRKNFDRLTSLINNAEANGAEKRFSGGVSAETHFMHPVILSGVNDGMSVMQEEIFGPVLPVISFSSVKEAIAFANNKAKPLALYVFSSNHKISKQIIKEISAGSVCVNDCVIQFSHPNLPFGGVGNSGVGRSHGEYGFRAFSNEKPVVKQKRGFTILYLIYPPYTTRVKKIIDLMIRWF